MKLDRDLKLVLIGYSIAGLVNAAMLVVQLLLRQWVSAFASLVWTAGVIFLILGLRSQQRTRDTCRNLAEGARTSGYITLTRSISSR